MQNTPNPIRSSYRRIYHPIQNHSVVFLETTAETNGEHTLMEVDLANGGGAVLHYHKTYSEKVSCIEGELHVIIGHETHVLHAGQSITIPPNVNHTAYNHSGERCRCILEIRPGHRGLEQALQIGYGLANDGLCDKRGLPSDRVAMAWIFNLSDSTASGWAKFFKFFLRKQVKKAIERGVDKYLIDRYVTF